MLSNLKATFLLVETRWLCIQLITTQPDKITAVSGALETLGDYSATAAVTRMSRLSKPSELGGHGLKDE